jgi:hypothetical protein
MSELAEPTLRPRRITHRRCLVSQSLVEVQRIAEARAGFEHWTLRCGRIEVQVSGPLESEALGWIEGELRPPR